MSGDVVISQGLIVTTPWRCCVWRRSHITRSYCNNSVDIFVSGDVVISQGLIVTTPWICCVWRRSHTQGLIVTTPWRCCVWRRSHTTMTYCNNSVEMLCLETWSYHKDLL